MKVLNVILGVLVIIFGGWCLFHPVAGILGLVWVWGLLLCVNGVYIFVNYFKSKIGSGWDLFFAVIMIIGGLCLIFDRVTALFTETMLVTFMGTFMIVAGIARIIASFRVKKMQIKHWWFVLLAGILVGLTGVLIIFNPLAAVVSMGMLLGIGIVLQGVNFVGMVLSYD